MPKKNSSDEGLIRLNALDKEALSIARTKSDDIYGLEILGEINKARKQYGISDEVGYGTFYASLKRLEKNGLLKSRWGDDSDRSSSGARRRYYRITGLGGRVLSANLEYDMWLQTPVFGFVV